MPMNVQDEEGARCQLGALFFANLMESWSYERENKQWIWNNKYLLAGGQQKSFLYIKKWFFAMLYVFAKLLQYVVIAGWSKSY